MLRIEGMGIARGQGSQTYRVSLPSLHLRRGEVAAITGPSGCGKSTLLEMIGLILAPAQLKSFTLGDTPAMDIAAFLQQDAQAPLADLRARKLGFVLQTGGLLPFLNVRQNISLPRRMSGLPPRSDLVEDAIARLHLRPLLDKLPRQLSIGERQRVSFVRAIAHQPDLLLADEPTAALDPIQAHKLFELIIEIVQNFQIAALLVSHDWDLVRSCGIRNIIGVPSADSSQGTVFRDAA
ncbi:MAG: ABC transporter ATP-binding protein [Gammaproteobacteria bacterium]|nr:ABC transporter ATP-binding protein [Gammaproteobacteria bacterium]